MNRTKLFVKCPSAGARLAAVWNGRRIVIGALALITSIGVVAAPMSVVATPKVACSKVALAKVLVYIYDENDQPVLMAGATVAEGGVYNDSVCLGTIDANDMIVDGTAIVGYVVYPSPGG